MIFQSFYAQEWSSSLDSIDFYKGFNPEKALKFGFEALERKDINEISYELYEIYFKLGESFYLAKEYEQTFKYLSRSLAIYELVPTQDRKNKLINKPPWVLFILANVYFINDRFEKSKKLLLEATENFNLIEYNLGKNSGLNSADDTFGQKNFGLSSVDDTFGSISIKEGNFDQAEVYFKNSLQRRLEFDRKSDILFSYSKLIFLYFNTQRAELGLNYLSKAQKLHESFSKTVSLESDLFYSQIISTYASYLKSNGQLLEALEAYNKAKSIIYDFPQLHKQQVDILIANCLYDLKRFNDSEELVLNLLESDDRNVTNKIENLQLLQKVLAAQSRTKEILSINDSLNYYLKKQNQIRNIEFSDLESQLILSEKQKELNLNKIKYIKNQSFYIIFILSILAIVIILFYNYNYQKEKNSRLDLEKKQIMNELDSKNIELVSKANFIMQRNEFLINLNSKVDKISPEKVKKEISSVINAEKSYEEFDKIFTQVYPGFYENLKSKHDLSQTYLRLVAYIKMNENNNEIATLSGVSLRTVETQRYRLSKILNLKDDQDLNSYIKSI